MERGSAPAIVVGIYGLGLFENVGLRRFGRNAPGVLEGSLGALILVPQHLGAGRHFPLLIRRIRLRDGVIRPKATRASFGRTRHVRVP
jgi:hypothetical protein